MEETMIRCLMLILLMLSALYLYQGRVVVAVQLLLLVAFAVGAVMTIDQEEPYRYLLRGQATTDEYIKALVGGALLSGPVSLFWVIALAGASLPGR